ncbi:hypothetical protein GCM10007140_27280 [Priestia taiwanensis]|uniref:Uncharacterized protein n=1 Tax=Priestia taiwanensis TaxID=1347902 RepID=A0A917AVB8_9BACI|nr:hypothetical protein GCM10007140_27280 [Priestia taiwanensis]
MHAIALDTDTIDILKIWKPLQEEFGKINLLFSYDVRPTSKSTILRVIKRHTKLTGVNLYN